MASCFGKGAASEAAERVSLLFPHHSAAAKAGIDFADLRCGWKPHPFKDGSNLSFSAAAKAGIDFAGLTVRLESRTLSNHGSNLSFFSKLKSRD
jgi:hypothetical protein